jgi:hypothetical protein
VTSHVNQQRLSNIYFNSTHLRCCPTDFLDRNLVGISHFSHAWHAPHPSYPPLVNSTNNIGRTVQITRLFSALLHCRVTLCSLSFRCASVSSLFYQRKTKFNTNRIKEFLKDVVTCSTIILRNNKFQHKYCGYSALGLLPLLLCRCSPTLAFAFSILRFQASLSYVYLSHILHFNILLASLSTASNHLPLGLPAGLLSVYWYYFTEESNLILNHTSSFPSYSRKATKKCTCRDVIKFLF